MLIPVKAHWSLMRYKNRPVAIMTQEGFAMSMLRRLVLAVLLLSATVFAGAADYSDVYFDPNEAGWGAFLVQSDTTQFLAFFIYGPDGKPTWYTAQLTDDGTGNYTGTLYAISGTYFANPWQGYTINAAGTAEFRPSDSYHATLKYTVTGIPTVTKAIQRQTLSPYVMGGNYSGSMAGSISGCIDPSGNDPAFRARYGLSVTQAGDTSATLTFTFVDTNHNGIVCTGSGPLTHLGRLYQMAGTLACTGPGQDGIARPATIDSFHPTGQGIEGKITSPNFGGGCTGTLHFAAVKNVNN
jgi:hypothetical protein